MLGVLLYIILKVLMGGVSCFFGKRVYFPILMLTVFTTVLTAAFSLFEISWKTGLGALAVGAAAAFLSIAFYKLGVFILGSLLGAAFGQLFISLLPVYIDWLHIPALLLPALILGLCALKWCPLFIMASTAYGGAEAIILPLGFLAVHFKNLPSFVYADGLLSTMANLGSYLQGDFSRQYALPLFAATVLAAAAGFLVQFQAEKRAVVKVNR